MHGGDAVGYNVSYSILFIPYQPFSARSVIKYVRKILGIWNKINSFATDEDHPRGCGENHVHGGYCRVYLGSPPQVRGKQKAAALDYLPIGITPADAGKTNRLYYTFIRQKKQHMTFGVILSVHHKYWLRLLCAYMFFLYFRQYYSFIETYSIRYDKTLLYIFMFRCDNILILPVLPAFEPNRIALRFHLKYS